LEHQTPLSSFHCSAAAPSSPIPIVWCVHHTTPQLLCSPLFVANSCVWLGDRRASVTTTSIHNTQSQQHNHTSPSPSSSPPHITPALNNTLEQHLGVAASRYRVLRFPDCLDNRVDRSRPLIPAKRLSSFRTHTKGRAFHIPPRCNHTCRVTHRTRCKPKFSTTSAWTKQ
jgi:hypothetical protein